MEYFYSQGRVLVRHQDEYRDLISGTLESHNPEDPILIHCDLWQGVFISTPDKSVILEMCDSSWIYTFWSGPGGDQFIRYFGEGRRPRIDFPSDGNIDDFLSDFPSQVTLYHDLGDQSYNYLFWDGVYRNPESRKEKLLTPIQEFLLPLHKDLTFYQINSKVIVGFDCYGTLKFQTSELEGILESFQKIEIPHGLHRGDEFSRETNFIVENRLNEVRGHPWTEYQIVGNCYYFGHRSMVPWLRIGDNFQSLEDPHQIEPVVLGPLRRLTYNPEYFPEAVLITTTDGQALIVGRNASSSSILDKTRDWTGDVLRSYNLGSSDKFYKELSGTFHFGNILKTGGSQSSNAIYQTALRRHFANLYGLMSEEPQSLNGYSRVNLKTIWELRDQLVRIEVDPILAPFAGPVGTNNKIITVLTLDGQKLFVKAQMTSDYVISEPE